MPLPLVSLRVYSKGHGGVLGWCRRSRGRGGGIPRAMMCSVIGLGKVGSVMGAVYAASGHVVLGVDPSVDVVAAINSGIAPHVEPGLDHLLRRSEGRLRAQTEISASVVASDIVFVIVPTPSLPGGLYDHSIVRDVFDDLGRELADSNSKPTIVLASTVTPEACARELLPRLEGASRKKSGEGFDFVYSPQFIALGSVARNLAEPDFVLVGEGSLGAGDKLETFLAEVVAENTKFFRMSTTSAEIAKIAVNSFVTMKISFANMIGEICRKSVNADADEVLAAVGADRRIGSAYLKAALGYGGPCFPRDNAALAAFAERISVDALIPSATDEINDRQPTQILISVLDLDPRPEMIAVLGLAYKPDTPVVERSQSVDVANLLVTQGFTVRAFDPLVESGKCEGLDSRVNHVASLAEAIAGADVVILATPWSDLRNELPPMNDASVIDPWGVLGKVNA